MTEWRAQSGARKKAVHTGFIRGTDEWKKLGGGMGRERRMKETVKVERRWSVNKTGGRSRQMKKEK